MSEEHIEQKETKNKQKSTNICIGLDVGTMNIVCSRSDANNCSITSMTRNVFLPLNPDEVSISELTDFSYVKGDDGELFIIGEDAFKFANIFGQKVSRPMEKGLISPNEINAIDVLSLIIKEMIGDTKNNDVFCSYSVPAEAIDESRSVVYHEKVFGRILGSIGVNYSPVNEAMAIIYSECKKEKFSGIAISYGAGMCNVAISYKGVEVLTFSTAKSGDYIDKSVGESLGIVPNRITQIKEKDLDLSISSMEVKNKKKRRILEALEYYYSVMIDYTIKKMIEKFEEEVDIEIDESIPIVISGGTSMPNGFLELFKSTISKYGLPFEVSEIRRASDPLTAVSNGLLIRTISDIQKEGK